MRAEEPAVLPAGLSTPPLNKVTIDDAFWSPRLKIWRETTFADCFAKFEKDGAFSNFDKIRDGVAGPHGGPQWMDGLVYEMIRAGADFIATQPSAPLEARLDGYIARIADAAAKDPDGYLNTHTQMKEPTHRWGQNGGHDKEQHDLYNAGALVDAGVHYFRATGKTKLLTVAVRLANHMADLMGPPPRKNIIPGHALGEEAMVKLYELFRAQPALKGKVSVPVDEQRYLKLAQFWIENRGHAEGRQSFGAYDQDDQPVLGQRTIEGHAVRATLLWSGVAAAARTTGRNDYLDASVGIWKNMVDRRMYVTGGLGAVGTYEGFGGDYDLPNNGYLETCAAVGAGFFHQNLALACADAKYADELERVLYNGALCGVSLKGDSYFYENPLEASPARRRWQWHPCPCCPPMFLKLMGELPSYLYAQDAGGIYVNQFIAGRAALKLKANPITLRQTTRYPWEGQVTLRIDPEHAAEFDLHVRLPAWCAEPQLRVNDEPISTPPPTHGYATLRRTWKAGDKVELTLPMPVQRVHADPQVKADTGRVALRRGPIIYCLESADNDGHLRDLIIPPDAQLRSEFRADLFGGVTIIKGTATLREPHSAAAPPRDTPHLEFTAIPYFANGNREPTSMMVWMAETPEAAQPVTLASRATASASHCNPTDTTAALNDLIDPSASDDSTIRRFTWWDHRGTKEWVQYDFARPQKVSATEVYWWDERRIKAHCRVPQSWQVLYREGDQWKPVRNTDPYATDMDHFNRVRFDPVNTMARRIEVQLQPEWSGGILEWKVE